MVFWTPDVITPQLSSGILSTTKQVVCCQTDIWNGTDYPDFDFRLSEVSKMKCITLFLNNDDINSFIDTIWDYVSTNEKLILSFIELWRGRRRNELYQQYKNGEKLDVGIYDCIDLLSLLDERIVLIIRVSGSIEGYFTSWLGYASLRKNIKIKILVLYSEKIKNLRNIKHFPRAVFPKLSEGIIIETCSDAIHYLTGKHTSYEILKKCYSQSSSLKEFIGYAQTSVLYQIAPSSFNWQRKIQL